VRRDAPRRAKKSVILLNTGLEPMTTGKKRVSFRFKSNFCVKLTLALTREQKFSVA